MTSFSVVPSRAQSAPFDTALLARPDIAERVLALLARVEAGPMPHLDERLGDWARDLEQQAAALRQLL